MPGNIFIESDKAVLFRVMTTISIVLGWFYFKKQKSVFIPKLDPILATGTFGLLFSASFSVLLSASPHVSFWGSMQRPLSTLCYVFLIIFILLILGSFEKHDFERGIKAIISSSALVSIYSLMQVIGIDFIGLSSDSFSGRASSFLGHPSFLGQFSLVTIFLTFYAISKSLLNKNALYGLLALEVLALLSSGNRASMLGLLVGGFIYMIINNKYRIKALALGSFIVFSFGALQFVPLDTTPFLNRLSLDNRNFQTVETRIEIWINSFDLIKKKPLLGHGPEMFSFTFAPYINSDLIANESLNSRPDRAHNFIVQTLHDYGFLGFAFLMMIIVWALKSSYKEQEYILLSLIIGYLTSMLFGFQSLPDALIIFFGLAYLASKRVNVVPVHIKKITGLCICILAFIILSISCLQFQANYHFANDNFSLASKYGYMYNELRLYDGFYSTNSVLIEKVARQNPLNNDAWYIRGYHAYKDSDYIKASQLLDQSLKLFPSDIKSIELYAKIKFEMGEFRNSLTLYNQLLDLVPDFWSTDFKGEDFNNKKRIFLKENPDFPVNFIYIARAYFELDDIDSAFKFLEYSDDSYDKFHTYAVIYQRLGEDQLSEEYLEKSFSFES